MGGIDATRIQAMLTQLRAAAQSTGTASTGRYWQERFDKADKTDKVDFASALKASLIK